MGGQEQTLAAGDEAVLESLLAFWAEAGVDAQYADEPINRLAERARPLAAPTAMAAAPAPPAPAGPDIAAAIAEARRLAAEAQDLSALEQSIAGFDGCSLKFEGARRAVFARGNTTAPVMVIGEGPGADEDAQGLPFVGRAGQLLDKMLAAAGLTGQVFITNTVYWRPPGNRTPTPAEQLVCRPFLEQAINLVQPRFLLLVGGASAKSVLKRDEGILALRGRWFEWTSEDQNLVILSMPTLHPAFLLRQPAAKKKAWSDLLTLTERLDRPDRPA
ncbi:uracil-DNA glycosylase [soil metagenome]